MSQSVQETQNINYISELRKIFIGRNNQPVSQRFKIDYRITSKYYFQVINAINQIVDITGKNYQLFISKTNNRGQKVILSYANSFSIVDQVLCFVIDTYTSTYLNEIKNVNGEECQITIVASDGVSTQVVLRDNVLCFPRPYQQGVTPTIITVQQVFDGTVPVSGSFGAGTNIALSDEVNTFGFGTGIRTSTEDQTVIGRYNEMDGSKSFIVANGVAGTEKNIFTVDWDGNVEAGNISATALTLNGEEFSLSGIDEKFAATSAWVNNTFETKVDAVSSFNALNLEIQGVADSLSAYAKTIDVPTKISDLTNDSDFATTGYVQDAIDAATSGTGDLYETKVDANSKFNYLSTQINETNDNIYQNYALKSEVPTRVSQLTNDEDFASKTYVGEKDQEVLAYVGNNYTTNATFNSSVSNLSGAVSNLNNTLTSNYAPISTLPTQISELENDVGYITGVNLDPYALKTELPTKVSELENDVGYVTSSQIEPSRLTNKKSALIDRDVKEYNFRIHYQENIEVFVNWQQTKDGILYISPIDRFELEEGKQIEVEQFVKPVGEFNAVSGNGVQIADLPETFGEDKILVFKRFITNDNGVYKQFAKFEFEYSNEDVEQLIHEPLTFIALEDNTKISFDKDEFSGYVGHEPTLALQYTINEGEWQTYTFGEEITLNQGEELSFQNLSGTYSNDASYYTFYFRSSQGKFNVEGSIKSLADINKFSYHFQNLTGLIDASKLELPNVLEAYNFFQMFKGCTSLTRIPKLPATTMKNSCYGSMFANCTSLEYISEDLLPATTLGQSCYYQMFTGCTSLKNVPKLIATTLADSCYRSMFAGCTSLTEVPDDLLPATTLAANCYHTMFGGCINLRKAPRLPAKTLDTNCYQYLFNGCTSLNEIDVDFTSWGTNNDQFCHGWVANVATEGVFKKTTSLPALRNNNHIPSGWLIENEDDLNFIAHGNVQIELIKIGNPSGTVALKYSTDGETFQDYNIGDVISLSAGQVLSMYNTTSSFVINNNDGYYFSMSGTGYVELEGHLDALVNHTLGYSFCYGKIFQNCTRIFDASKLDVGLVGAQHSYKFYQMFRGCSNLIYPPKLKSTTLAQYCYQWMFHSCTSLTEVPNLPATTMANACYNGMFYNCTSLTAVPRLPATTLAVGCYQGMFGGCTSLSSVPEDYLPATTLASQCYYQMFKGCSSLTSIPRLPAKIIPTIAYHSMFSGCTSLSSVPKDFISATSVASEGMRVMFASCSHLIDAPDINVTEFYQNSYANMFGMFDSCAHLTGAPEILPATTLAQDCYGNMFNRCYDLTDAPHIAATGLVSSCCQSMFYNCTNLSSISVDFQQWDDIENATYNWVNRVAASGIFRKPASLNRVEGPSNIPQGWEKIDSDGVTFICKDAPVEVALVQVGSPSAITMFYSVNGNDLQSYSIGSVVSLQPGQTLTFKGTTQHFSLNSNGSGLYRFTTTGNGFVDVEGNIQGLVNMREDVGVHMFTQLFHGCTRIQDASRLKLPATTVAGYCYYWLFRNCTNLTGIPKLPATTLAGNCYLGMFDGCTSLSSVPEDYLPATTLANNCYNFMFQNCSSLTAVPRLPATTIAGNCYAQMFVGCTSISSVPEDLLPATSLANSCYLSMFQNCTSLTNVLELPATVLALACYQNMFNGCTSLTSVPEDLLPATEMVKSCYYQMFRGCTALTNMPVLPATEIVSDCYNSMFNECSSLTGQVVLPATKLASNCYNYMFRATRISKINLPAKLLLAGCYYGMFSGDSALSSVTVGFTAWDEEESCTTYWLNSVAANGQFYCPTSLDTTTRDIHHVPSGWSINPASTRGGESKGGSKKKGGDEIIPEQEEIIEEQIPPIQKQIHITEFKDTNQSHIKGFIQPLPAEQIEDGQEKEDLPKEELRK